MINLSTNLPPRPSRTAPVPAAAHVQGEALELHYFRSCPHSTTVRWVIQHKGMNPRLVHTPLLFRRSLKGMSGQSWPPVLKHGTRVLVHQHACIAYLEMTFPTPCLGARDGIDSADLFILSHWVDRAFHYVMVAIKYLNEANYKVARESILEGRERNIVNRLLVQTAPRVQAKHLFHQDYVKTELPELQLIFFECLRAIDARLKRNDFVAGPVLTYVDMQVYANLRTLHGCQELSLVNELGSLRSWQERIESSFSWPHT